MSNENKSELKKLTHDAIFGKITQDQKPKKGESIPSVRIFGVIDGVIDGTGQYGAFTKFHGDFEGVNLKTGEVFVAPVAILPSKDETSMLRKAFEQAQAQGNPSVSFALDYAIAFSDRGSLGYTFIARDAAKPRGMDPLAALRSSLPKALTGPKGK